MNMFMINEKELNEILEKISKNCCKWCSSYTCSESDCDIHKIGNLLQNHLEYNVLNIDEELPFN